MTTAPGLIIAAPSSGSGKTVVTLGILRALTRRGLRVASAKAGPDYIDPAFHAAATGRPCVNLDGWAMRPATIAGLAGGLTGDLAIAEGVMGLFDGADVEGAEDGSTAHLAARTGWPVVLVMDVRGQAGSAAAVLTGFARLRPDVRVVGVIFNKVGGDGHRRMLLRGVAQHCPEIAVLGLLPRDDSLSLPSRHLGLVQACERDDLTGFLDHAAEVMARHIDLDRLAALAQPGGLAAAPAAPLPPPGQRVAVARDRAFAFAYAWMLDGWRAQGAELSFFSPLAGEAPLPDADAIYLPGGYPELHGAALAASATLPALRAAADRGVVLFGECGGYMVLGQSLEDADGVTHAMAGLLPLATSLKTRRLHLGYRQGVTQADSWLGPAGTAVRGHEFHYATVSAEQGASLFNLTDAAGRTVGPAGLSLGRVCGSFLHLIDRAGDRKKTVTL